MCIYTYNYIVHIVYVCDYVYIHMHMCMYTSLCVYISKSLFVRQSFNKPAVCTKRQGAQLCQRAACDARKARCKSMSHSCCQAPA